MPTLAPDDLGAYITRIFGGTGAPEDEARMVAEHLVGANLRGHDSHGAIRTSAYVEQVHDGRLTPAARHTIERESDSTALIDGHWNYGQVVAFHGMNLAIEKARATGVGIVSAYNSGHIGRLGAYGEQAVAAGMLGIASVNSPGVRLTAPFGGAQRRLPTNPIAVAMPTGNVEEPFVLDMATSIVAEGKLRVARNKGVPVPEGWLIDANGEPTTDPNDFYGQPPDGEPGALLPFGGYKGFGLSMAVEALTGMLSGAGTSVEGQRGSNGVFLMAIDLERFQPRQAFTGMFDELIEHVKAPPYQPGVDEVLIAGEPERRRLRERLASGVELDDETWRQITAAAVSVGVEPLE